MVFNSVWFVFVFLPLSLLLYYLFPKKLRRIPLLLTSLVFYAWGDPKALVLLLFAVLFNYLVGLQMRTCDASGREGLRRMAFITGVIVDVAVLLFFKYWDSGAEALYARTGVRVLSGGLASPLGVSFYTFTVLSYLIDVYRRSAPAETNLLDMAVYVSFFPKISMGPIVRYEEIQDQLKRRETSLSDVGVGVHRFLRGLIKKVLLADNLGVAFSAISGMSSMASATAWLGMIFYSLQLFFDFSGYSDMAIGMARMFGFRFAKNFDHPYCSGSVSEFLRRWHISLGAWFREYIYIPLGGNRRRPGRVAFNLLVVWVLTGIWHGSTLNFLCWGLYHGLFVLLERFVLGDAWERIPKPLRVLPTCLVVFFGWVMFFSGSMPEALAYYAQMFGGSHRGFFDGTTAYYLRTNLVLLVAAVLCSSPLVSRWREKLVTGSRLGTYLCAGAYSVLFVLAVAFMMSSTYSAFLYAQF